MKQITKITLALGFIILLASCQSSSSGCYDFGEVNQKVSAKDTSTPNSKLIFTKVVCKP